MVASGGGRIYECIPRPPSVTRYSVTAIGRGPGRFTRFFEAAAGAEIISEKRETSGRSLSS